MVTNDLGACEWFVWDLRRSGLIDRGQLDQIVSEFLKKNPRAEPPGLAEYLVGQGTLTPFQAERILGGKAQGLVLGPYVLVDGIGQGSMGQVYKATSKNDAQHYAIKVLPRRSMWNVRLARRQVRSFGQFSHPAVVPFVDVGTAGGLHYLAWPMADGETLEAIVDRDGPLSAQQTALVGTHLAQALSVCNQNNIFHGLVKPSNVMIGPDGQTRLLDFGIGSLLVENEGESLVDTMSTANTLTSGLDCAAPESIMDPTNRTPAGDQYSLGCTLYYCLTGRPPFPDGSAVEKMMAHQAKQPTPVRDLAPDCPDGLAEVIAKLMAKAPEGRYASTDEVVENLEPNLGELAASAASLAGGQPARSASADRGRSADRATPPPYAAPPTPPRPSSGFGGHTPPPQPVGHSTPLPPNNPGRALPSRASFQLPAEASEVPLTAARPEPAPFSDPSMRSSTAWLNMPEEKRSPGLFSSNMGTALIAVVLTALVFVGAYFLLNMNNQ